MLIVDIFLMININCIWNAMVLGHALVWLVVTTRRYYMVDEFGLYQFQFYQ